MFSDYGTIQAFHNPDNGRFGVSITSRGGYTVAVALLRGSFADFVAEAFALLERHPEELDRTDSEPGTLDVGEVFRKAFED